MISCFVFSGTSEGRQICETLADNGVKCLVFVATEYGNIVMKKHNNIDVFVGRLDREDIEEKIRKMHPDFIIDATHPHAEIITQNVIEACSNTDTKDKYIRVDRTIENIDTVLSDYDLLKNDFVTVVSSVDEAVNHLKNTTGMIMLTTGVKELHNFCVDGIRERIVVRVLPGIESIEEVNRCNISSKNTIAMEGPFSKEMNIALIKQYNAKFLVTKNSGKRGGFIEKVEAAKECGIDVYVIDKQKQSSGVSIEKAIEIILGEKSKTSVYLVGTSVCDINYLSVKAKEIIESSDVIIGASRMIEFASTINNSAKMICEYKADEVVNCIDNNAYSKVAVLFSGDTGLCSGAKGVYEKLKNRDDIVCEIVPGISSISYFASRIGIQYSDYPFISLHGQTGDYIELINNYGGLMAICSGHNDAIKVANDILKLDKPEIKIVLGINLGAVDEKIIYVKDENDLNDLNEGLYVIGAYE